MAHLHSLYDTDPHFVIDGETRQVTNASEVTGKVVQYDHNSERLTFELPRYIDGHDMTDCNSVQVHYINVDSANKNNKYTGVYEVDDFQTSPNSEEVIICSWLLSQNATQYAGLLSFVLCFACTDDDGTLVYSWNTEIYKGLTVSAGIYNGEEIMEEYADILAAWDARISALEQGGGGGTVTEEQISAAVEEYLKKNPIVGGSTVRIANVELLASKWVGNESPYSQVVTISGVTPYSQVDLTPNVEQLTIFHDKDLAFVTENEDGVVTVYAIGDKPLNDYTMQVTIKEVSA